MGKKIELGRFKTLKQAISARKAAEEIYYKPILEKHRNDTVPITYLSDGRTIDLTGKEFPHFKVLRYGGAANGRTKQWICECECGKTFVATSVEIREHKISFCGCIKEEKPTISEPVIQCHCVLVDGTNLTKIAKKESNKNNKSGPKEFIRIDAALGMLK